MQSIFPSPIFTLALLFSYLSNSHTTGTCTVVQQAKSPADISIYIGMSIQVPDTQLWMQLPLNPHSKAEKQRPKYLDFHNPHGRYGWMSCFLASAWPSPDHCSHRRVNFEGKINLSLFFSISLQLSLSLPHSLCHSTVQMK